MTTNICLTSDWIVGSKTHEPARDGLKGPSREVSKGVDLKSRKGDVYLKSTKVRPSGIGRREGRGGEHRPARTIPRSQE